MDWFRKPERSLHHSRSAQAGFPEELPGVVGTSMPVILIPRSAEKVRLNDAMFQEGDIPSSDGILTME